MKSGRPLEADTYLPKPQARCRTFLNVKTIVIKGLSSEGRENGAKEANTAFYSLAPSSRGSTGSGRRKGDRSLCLRLCCTMETGENLGSNTFIQRVLEISSNQRFGLI